MGEPEFYEFEDFRVYPRGRLLLRAGEPVTVKDRAFDTLLLLLENQGQLVERERFFREVWEGATVESNNLDQSILALRNALGDRTKPRQFIATVPNKGFKFLKAVTKVIEPQGILPESEITPSSPDQPKGGPTAESEISELSLAYGDPVTGNELESQSFNKLQIVLAVIGLGVGFVFFYYGATIRVCSADECLEQTTFIALATVFYGLLSGIGVLLECAYDFDRYGWKATKMIPSIVSVSAGSIFAALTVAAYMLQANGNYAFWTGLLFLVAGAITSCVLAAFVLPNLPVTAARVQTQSAIGAFCKNALIYFLPLYTVFGLLIFCFVYGSSAVTKNIAFPIAFAVAWMILFVFSYLSTNYLSDNLLTEKDGKQYKYHGLFSLLLQLRMIFCFIAALGSIVWYFIHTLP